MRHIRSTRGDQERDKENEGGGVGGSGDVAVGTTGRGARKAPATPGAGASTFSSAQEYVEFFTPLLLAELRAQVAAAVDEAGGNAPGVPVPAVVDSLVGREGIYHVVRIGLGRSTPGDAFQENDLVIIEKLLATSTTGTEPGTTGTGKRKESTGAGAGSGAGEMGPHHALGWVEAVETGPGAWSGTGGGRAASDGSSGVRLRVRTCLVDQPGGTVQWLTGTGIGGMLGSGSLDQPRERERREGILRVLSRQATGVKLSRLLSLTPPLREMQALLRFSKMPLHRTLLTPLKATAERTTTTHDRSSEAPEGVSADLWSAVTSGLNPPQRTAVSAVSTAGYHGALSGAAASRVVLIQGPPGTGKTHTIASAIAVILSANTSHSGNSTGDDARAQGNHPRGGGGAGQAGVGGRQGPQQTQRLRRVLVCAQSNSAVDELVARLSRGSVPRAGSGGSDGCGGQQRGRKVGGQLAASTVSTVPSLVRLGREEAVRPDALPFLVTRLIGDRAAAARAAVTAAARAAASTETKHSTKQTNDGNNNHKSGGGSEDGMSTIQARLDRLGDEIIAGTAAAEGASRDATSSIHLDMLHAQRRRLLGELAGARQEQRTERNVVRASAGSAWSQVVGGAEIVCATLSGAGLLAADRTGARGGGRGGFGGGAAHVKSSAAGGGAGGGSITSAADEVEAMMLAAESAVPLFDAVVIDEAAQAMEPATLIPLRWLRPGGTVILVGDPQQLAPTVLSRGVAARRLSRSMFERLQTAGARVHLLSVQYRMHPEIRAFPSERFYGGALVDGRDAADRGAAHHARVSNCGPYVVFDVAEGVERRGSRSASLSNIAEAELAAAAYGQLQKAAAAAAAASGDQDGPPPIMTVGVVTPYRDQMMELRRKFAPLLARADACYAPVEFATVDGVQGREFDAVIFSCVRAPTRAGGGGWGRSRDRVGAGAWGGGGAGGGFRGGTSTESASQQHHRRAHSDDMKEEGGAAAADAHSRRTIGFLGDPRRLNVALTRPRRTLIVLGHAATLRSADRLWASLWDDADRRGLSVLAEQPFNNLFAAAGGADSRAARSGGLGGTPFHRDRRRGSSPRRRVSSRTPSPPPPPLIPPTVSVATTTIDLTSDDDPDVPKPPRKRAKQQHDDKAALAEKVSATRGGGKGGSGGNGDSGIRAAPNVASGQFGLACTADTLTRLLGAAITAAAAAVVGTGDGVPRAIAALETLKNTAVTVALLSETQAGKAVKKLSKQSGMNKEVAAAAVAVVTAWKKMVTG
jgi:hypothetical protein